MTMSPETVVEAVALLINLVFLAALALLWDAVRPGPEPDTLKLEGPWEDRIGDALKKKRPPGGFPKPPDRPVRPKRPAPTADPIQNALDRRRKAGKFTKAEIQAEMLRANCTRSQALANLKARNRTAD